MFRIPTIRPCGIAFAALATVLVVDGKASPSDSLEQEVKAAMVYNFTRFIEWPARAFKDGASPLVVAVVADETAARSMEVAFRGKDYAGRPIVLKRLESTTGVDGCHVLYLSQPEKRAAEDLLKAVAQSPVLTISDLENFPQRGGMIGFVRVDSRVRFRINNGVASQAGLTISSKLLSLSQNGGERR